MLIDDTKPVYRTQKELAAALDVTAQAVSGWRRRRGGKIPELHARRLAAMTYGRLRFDPGAYGLDS